MEKLTIQEEEVMLHIWSMGECFVKDIVAKFPEPKPPYTTVASIVNNLKRKGYVTAKRFGISAADLKDIINLIEKEEDK